VVVILTGSAEKFVAPSPRIRDIDATRKGVNLTNGRFITWNVVKMKIEMDELSIPFPARLTIHMIQFSAVVAAD
jgi:hypothetical protein